MLNLFEFLIMVFSDNLYEGPYESVHKILIDI